MTHTATSKNGIPIRLTEERWMHITIGHPEVTDCFFEVLETIESPEIVYHGTMGELLAVKKLTVETEKYLVVVYKELPDQTGVLIDGFIITAYAASRKNAISKTTHRMAAIEVLHNLDSLLPWLVRHENIWSHYDQEADVLYLHFKKPNYADDSELRDDNIIVRYENGEVIGLTIMNASKRVPEGIA